MSKEEITADWDKVPYITKVFTLIVISSALIMILSIIIGIWWEAFPTSKPFLTGLVLFAISLWLIRTEVLDEDGDIKEEYRKNGN